VKRKSCQKKTWLRCFFPLVTTPLSFGEFGTGDLSKGPRRRFINDRLRINLFFRCPTRVPSRTRSVPPERWVSSNVQSSSFPFLSLVLFSFHPQVRTRRIRWLFDSRGEWVRTFPKYAPALSTSLLSPPKDGTPPFQAAFCHPQELASASGSEGSRLPDELLRRGVLTFFPFLELTLILFFSEAKEKKSLSTSRRANRRSDSI